MIQQPIYLIFVTAGLFWLAGCASNQETVASQKQSNWAGADPTALSSAEPEPDEDIMPGTHFAAGQLFEKQGALNKAIIQYQKALSGDPQHVASLNRLGVLFAKMDRHGDAEDALRRAVEIQPDSAVVRNNLGFEYVLQQRWSDAEAEFRNAVKLAPQFQRAHVNLGMTLAKLDRFGEALAEFRLVLPQPDAFYNLGLMFRSKNRYCDAAESFELALEFSPDFAAAAKQLEQIQPRLALTTELEPALNESEWQALVNATPIELEFPGAMDHPEESVAGVTNAHREFVDPDGGEDVGVQSQTTRTTDDLPQTALVTEYPISQDVECPESLLDWTVMPLWQLVPMEASDPSGE